MSLLFWRGDTPNHEFSIEIQEDINYALKYQIIADILDSKRTTKYIETSILSHLSNGYGQSDFNILFFNLER